MPLMPLRLLAVHRRQRPVRIADPVRPMGFVLKPLREVVGMPIIQIMSCVNLFIKVQPMESMYSVFLTV